MEKYIRYNPNHIYTYSSLGSIPKKPMLRTVIFDLSEVLISGLEGIEKPLSSRLQVPEESIMPAFRVHQLNELFCGVISEDAYISSVITHRQWKISSEDLKLTIRQNFHNRVPGMDTVLDRLAVSNEIILLSDHVKEWIAYIRLIHPFLAIFKKQFFSFELGHTKRETKSFDLVLNAIARKPEECLLIDDNPVNISIAKTLGIGTIQFTNANELSVKLNDFSL
ncbi:MAG: HAD-IA family hydrolase [Chloroflexi bacterium]|nr:HAD-IA family hydrolase [Chloroflexota bacterium]